MTTPDDPRRQAAHSPAPHEDILEHYKIAYGDNAKRTIVFEGKEFILHPKVFNPSIGFSSNVLVAGMPAVEGKTVLDFGCGSGVVGVTAALRGAAAVTLADVDPLAVANAKANVERHGVAARCTCLVSDIFDGLSGRRFDTIMFNMPFTEETVAPEIEAEVPGAPNARAYFDPGFSIMGRFFAGLRDHLSPKGAAYCTFGNMANSEKLDPILKDNGLVREIVHRQIAEDPTLEVWVLRISPA